MLHSASLETMQLISLCGSNETSYQRGAILLLVDRKTDRMLLSCLRAAVMVAQDIKRKQEEVKAKFGVRLFRTNK